MSLLWCKLTALLQKEESRSINNKILNPLSVHITISCECVVTIQMIRYVIRTEAFLLQKEPQSIRWIIQHSCGIIIFKQKGCNNISWHGASQNVIRRNSRSLLSMQLHCLNTRGVQLHEFGYMVILPHYYNYKDFSINFLHHHLCISVIYSAWERSYGKRAF